jgi:protein-arginine kinase activator protein McsA
MEGTVSNELESHIMSKVEYHQKLLDQNIATEQYLECAKHRDEIKRLTGMLTPVEPETVEGL